MLTTILKSFDAFVVVAATPTSITLSFTGIGWIAIPISSGRACGLTISIKYIFEIVMPKYEKCKKQCRKDQQTIKSSDKL